MVEANSSPLQRFPERLRTHRQRNNLGLRELAQRAQVTPAMISMVERGKIHPSIDTLFAVARALNISLAELFEEPVVSAREYVVHRVADRCYAVTREGRLRYEDSTLTPDGIKPQEMEPSVMTFHRHSFVKQKVSLRGDQLIFGLSGSFNYACGDEVFTVNAGDSVFFHSHEEHGPLAINSEHAEYLVCYTDELYGWLDMRLDPRGLFARPPRAPQNLTPIQRLAWRIRYARSQRGFLQTTVRARTGLSYGMISHIESGRSKPSLTTLDLIARALSVPISYFFDEEVSTCRASFVPLGERVLKARVEGGHRYRNAPLIVPELGEPLFFPEYREYDRKGFVPQATQSPGQIFVMVMQGVIDFTHGADTHRLNAGDTIYGMSHITHGVSAIVSDTAAVLYFTSNLTQLLKRVFDELRRRVR
ncbi:MAG: helix-turn-helix domain-containing protein [bacterium]|nr:helix-turn-helix domain-containing protein [bacterium]